MTSLLSSVNMVCILPRAMIPEGQRQLVHIGRRARQITVKTLSQITPKMIKEISRLLRLLYFITNRIVSEVLRRGAFSSTW
jgi:hypothetical protein